VGHGQHLDAALHRTVNELKVEHLERDPSDIWRKHHPCLLRRGASPLHRR
jgi:hypothetical protein